MIVGLVVSLLISATASLVLRSIGPSEPVYQGRTLREWLRVKSDSSFLYNYDGVKDAVQHIGTNAFPVLLQMLRAHDSPLKIKFLELANKQHLVRVHLVSADDQMYGGWSAFGVLKETASNAVPGLIEDYLANASEHSQVEIGDILGRIGTAADAAVPVLAETLANTNASPGVRGCVAFDLGNIGTRPKVAVPVLINCLKDPDSYVRFMAIESLGSFGKDADNAVPALENLLKDPDTEVSRAATNAIETIECDMTNKDNLRP
jgi:HEAT repeat protein